MPWYHSWHLCKLCLPFIVTIWPQYLWTSFTVFLHRIGTEGSKGTNSVYPAWCGLRKFCRLPVLIFSFPLLTLLFPPSPTLEPLLCSLYVCSFCCRCLIWFTIYFYIAHMNETLKDLSFSILLISLSLIPSRSIYIVTNGEFPLFYG